MDNNTDSEQGMEDAHSQLALFADGQGGDSGEADDSVEREEFDCCLHGDDCGKPMCGERWLKTCNPRLT